MTEREKLIDLIVNAKRTDPETGSFTEWLADFLLDQGVIAPVDGCPGADRVRKLIQADRDGRCAVLPCKPSDITVYQLRGKKHALGVGVHPRHIYCATVWANGRYQLEHQGQEPCLDKDFGKTWFLKEEEAKAALEKVKKG